MPSMFRVLTTLKQAIITLLLATFMGSVAHSAAPEKVLRMAFTGVETGFDPQRVDDLYSGTICTEIFEPMLEFDYLARPIKLVPLVAESIPVAESNGLIYTFRIKPGIYFADDPVFKGKRREMVAADLLYALERLVDPANRSPYSWVMENKIVGLDAQAARAAQSGHFDYDAPVSGLKIVDRYTLRITLTHPDYTFLYLFTMPVTAPVVREVIEAYASDTMAHPVGTGPFMLKDWVRRAKIVLERNPNYRGFVLDTQYADPHNEEIQRVIREVGGKRLPQLDRVEVYPIESGQPRFLSFMNGDHDVLQDVPASYLSQVLVNNQLVPRLKTHGVKLFRELSPYVGYDMFNMENPLVGGYDPQHVALRRAIAMGYNLPQQIKILLKDQGIPAHSPIAPGVIGYDPNFHSTEQEYNPARANALLDVFGYRDVDGDGYREQPNGQSLVLEYKYSSGSGRAREAADLWVKSMKTIGLRIDTRGVQFADLLRDRKAGNFMMSGAAWVADYPDAQNFLQLLYGPNTGSSNDARFKLPAYDKLYEQAIMLPDSPERNQLYREMSRLVLAYAPWHLDVNPSDTHLARPWVLGYLKHPVPAFYTRFKYLDIDVAAQQATQMNSK